MQQRVAIARALALDPQILLMDEPFGALDEITRIEMQDELLRVWSSRRKTVIFVTPFAQQALYLADRVIVSVSDPDVSWPNTRSTNYAHAAGSTARSSIFRIKSGNI